MSETNVSIVRSMYALGLRMLAEGVGKGPAKKMTIQKFANKEDGVNYLTANTAYHFVQQYSAADVEQLISYRGADGDCISWGHIRSLLRLDDQDQRDFLACRVAEEGWSTRQLASHVDRLVGKPTNERPPGRRFPAASSKSEAKKMLAEIAQHALYRILDLKSPTTKGQAARGKYFAQLNPEIREAVAEAEESLRQIRDLIDP
jgi:hypothetical protein